jgi:EAL domain-containing protein (putative c-di-GMP-specific phosphodiesterase class I)
MLMGVESSRTVLEVASNDDPSRPGPLGLVSPTAPHPRPSRRTREAIGDVLAHGTVDIGFQPVVDLVSERTVGFEALVRGPIGTELETPRALFDAARDAGRLDELDWLCQRTALRAALRAGLRAPSVLFVNVEADSSGFLPLDLRALYAEATAQMVVAVELTERALTRRPGALLGRTADMRALGCVLALDDVGCASDSLAMMAVLAPDVVRLDLTELALRPEDELAEVVDAVAAHAERSGATVLVERVETPEQARLAGTLGARLAQGWLFGARGTLVAAPAPPPERQVHATFHPDPRDTTPFQILAEECEVRRASRTLLAGLSRHLEDQARAMGRTAIIVGAFAEEDRFDADARRRYADLARELAFCGVVGTEMPVEPAAGVRGGRLHAADPLAREWTVSVVSPHASATLTASAPANGEAGYDYALTHDRELAAAATAALMARIAT